MESFPLLDSPGPVGGTCTSSLDLNPVLGMEEVPTVLVSSRLQSSPVLLRFRPRRRSLRLDVTSVRGRSLREP